ncbi:MAG: CHRD domain-containing protein [Phycisphaerae bacterium]
MKSIRRSPMTTAAFVLITLNTVTVGEVLQFHAHLTGDQAEDCKGTGSVSTGHATFTLDTDSGDVDYHIQFTPLDSPENASHIHGPAGPCEFGVPILSLPFGNPKIGTYTLTIGQVQDMIAGLHYTNIHSEAFPDEEIRGQIQLVQGAVPATSSWGLMILTLLLAVTGTLIHVGRSAPAPS